MRFCTRSCVLIWTTSTIFSTIRCEARSCEITLIHAAGESYRRSALLCVVNVGLLDHFLHFFIREFLTRIFHHVTLILCKIWGGRLNSLSDGMDNFCFAISTARLSLSVIALSTSLSLNFAKWFNTADNSVFTFVSLFSRVLSCVLDCSCVQLLNRCTLIRHLLGRWRRLHDLLLRYLDNLLLQLVGGHALGRLLQHLVVRCLVWSSLLRYHVCRKTCLLSCLSDASWRVTSPIGALIGPPTAFPRTGPSVPWVSLPGPTGVITRPG